MNATSHCSVPWRFLCAGVLLFAGIGGAFAEKLADAPLTVLWTERRPFQYTGEYGAAKGILVEIGDKIFTQAGITHAWEFAPANRVLMSLKSNDKPLCAVGWYKSKEREAIAQFSSPIYQDKPLRGVFRASVNVATGTSIKDVLEDSRVRVLVKLGFAYGPVLDDLLAQVPAARIQRAAVDAPGLLQMVRADRADVVFLAQEEINLYEEADPGFKRDHKVIVFADLPKQDHRFIMCSKSVTPESMKRINAAIAATVKLK